MEKKYGYLRESTLPPALGQFLVAGDIDEKCHLCQADYGRKKKEGTDRCNHLKWHEVGEVQQIHPRGRTVHRTPVSTAASENLCCHYRVQGKMTFLLTERYTLLAAP